MTIIYTGHLDSENSALSVEKQSAREIKSTQPRPLL